MNDAIIQGLYEDALALLQRLIETPSFSRQESGTAKLIAAFLEEKGVAVEIHGNNVLARSRGNDPAKPTWLLNSHHDTVRPNSAYTRDPFAADISDGILYGLGSNDAGGALVAMIAAFLYFYNKENKGFNLVLAATAEEEISGPGGIESILGLPGPIDAALVGEPTGLQLAVAERGLVVLDGLAEGSAGHAARNEGESALLKALSDIQRLTGYKFEKVSPLLGPVSLNVTVIETDNKTHNIIPASCRFVVDLRVNELYTLEEACALLQTQVSSRLEPRSMRLRATRIAAEHPLVRAGCALGAQVYGSPTTSDKALMPFPALKVGPGDSARSHSANEFIYLNEIESGIRFYINLLNQLT